MNKHTTLNEYCKEKGITVYQFSKIIGLSYPYLFAIKDNRRANISVNTIRNIYNGTKQHFGEPLDLWDYIDREAEDSK